MSIPFFLRLEALCFLGTLVVTVLFQIATGRISLRGLTKRKDGSGQSSPARVLLVLATITIGARYLASVHALGGKTPDIGAVWLYLLGASCGVYIVEKAWVAFSLKSRT